MSCPDCFAGHTHEGDPKGKIETIHGLKTYIAEPPEGKLAKGIIVIIPDAFGIDFVNNRILVDHYAAKGQYKVYLPDFMIGGSAPAYMTETVFGIFNGSWIYKPYYLFWTLWAGVPWAIKNKPDKTIGTVKAFFKALRENEGANTPVGAAGFCWGGRHVITMAVNDPAERINGKPFFDAGFTAHPSYLKYPDDIEKVRLPISFAIGDKDLQTPAKELPVIEKIVEGFPEEYSGELKTYVNTGHGFAVRADHYRADAKQQAEEAEDQAIAWFQKWFAKISS